MKSEIKDIWSTIISTFLITLVIATTLYRISGINETMVILQESSTMIVLTEVVSIVYMAGIGTVILLCLNYLLKDHFPPEALARDDDYKRRLHRSPRIVSSNRTLQKDILDQVNS